MEIDTDPPFLHGLGGKRRCGQMRSISHFGNRGTSARMHEQCHLLGGSSAATCLLRSWHECFHCKGSLSLALSVSLFRSFSCLPTCSLFLRPARSGRLVLRCGNDSWWPAGHRICCNAPLQANTCLLLDCTLGNAELLEPRTFCGSHGTTNLSSADSQT